MRSPTTKESMLPFFEDGASGILAGNTDILPDMRDTLKPSERSTP